MLKPLSTMLILFWSFLSGKIAEQQLEVKWPEHTDCIRSRNDFKNAKLN